MILSGAASWTAAGILAGLGLIVSVLSALERRVPWVQRLGAFFGEGCRRTALFMLLGLPVPFWGFLYYAVLGIALAFARPLAFWAVMAGLGFECTFVLTMAVIRARCVFGLLDAAIVVLLAILTFDPRRAWPGLALAAAAFAGSFAVLSRENRVHLRKPPKDEVLDEIEVETEQGLNPALGPVDAPVRVIEFSDYLCPHCRKAQPAARRIRREFRGLVRWVYMDFPLDIHPGAKELARAPRCARDQGRFWEFHERVFTADGKLGPAELEALARSIGLDVDRFRACQAGNGHAREIERDIAEGVAAGISGTPTFLVNGQDFMAPSYSQLKRAVEQALKDRPAS